jgi:dihydrofolate synthase/folylpolyglutamate synthase
MILDGAHNPAAARALVDAMKELFPGLNPVLVFGAMADKDYSNMLAELVPIARRVILTRPDMARSADTRTLRKSASLHGIDVRSAETVARALDIAMENIHREDVVLITGSLFLAGEARSCLRFQDA